ncbi:hypothetical protein AVEN_255360-1 [Araneus ventricosus]|uniref:Uncharacterized protein n=1 Tax=Araneus ventricosus TaxID=182803 RepID=A0A4Y2J866_ARAVE|nr:hypothetical protein AVEN_255360-1 [Araneus ventricosus]
MTEELYPHPHKKGAASFRSHILYFFTPFFPHNSTNPLERITRHRLPDNPPNHKTPLQSRSHLKCESRALPYSGPQQASCKLPALIKELLFPASILYRHKWRKRIYSLPDPDFRFRDWKREIVEVVVVASFRKEVVNERNSVSPLRDCYYPPGPIRGVLSYVFGMFGGIL